MTLNELKVAIDQLEPNEVSELYTYLATKQRHPWSPEERIRRVREAAAFIRETMTPEQLDEAIAAMNDAV